MPPPVSPTMETAYNRAMINMTKSEYRSLSDAHSGVCVGSCQKVTADGVEPDARKYKCPQCGERTVYGIEEAVLMGRVEFAGMKSE